MVLLGFFAWFFRDPDRPIGPGLVSPADGRIREVVREGDRCRISIFMNVTDVHVNRFPVDADVVAVGSAGEGHRPAHGAGSGHTVQRRYTLDSAAGRLVSFVRPGDRRPKGSRLGMIVVGSRVDVSFPAERFAIRVRPGQHVRAGATTLAAEVP